MLPGAGPGAAKVFFVFKDVFGVCEGCFRVVLVFFFKGF